MYFKTTYFDETSNPTEIELICNKCGNIINILDLKNFDKISSDYCIVKADNNIKCECGNQCQSGFIQEKQNPNIKDITVNNYSSQQNIPKCPTCGSTNVISKTS